MSKIIAIIILAIDAALIYLLYIRFGRVEEEKEEDDLFDTAKLQDDIRVLNVKMDELAQLDDMIIELQLCKPSEVLKSFRTEWIGTTGTNHSFDFLADGESQTSERLMELATVERERLNAHIVQAVYDLHTKAKRLSYPDFSDEE